MLGKDSYLQVQKEVTHGTPVTGSETMIPILPETLIQRIPELIVTEDIMADRTQKAEQIGSYMQTGVISMYAHPTLLGIFFHVMLGAAASVDNSDTTYTHTWLFPVSGVRAGGSMTVHQALGSELGDQYDGCIITGGNLSVDVKGNLVINWNILGQGFLTDVTRETTFTYPTEIPFNFSMVDFQYATVSQSIRSMSLEWDLGYNAEDDFFMNSQEISNPQFSDRPSVNGTFSLDSAHAFLDDALAQTSRAIDISIISSENAAGSTKWQLDFEVPGTKMMPDTSQPIVQDRMKQDISYNGSYGGATTGSSSVPVAMEVRLTNLTAAYA